MELCKPSQTILLVSIAGLLYQLLFGRPRHMAWWAIVGIFGTGVFQTLCYGGFENIAWVLMAIPILIVCFFLAIAIFASRLRIENVEEVPCGNCGRHHPHHEPCPSPDPTPCPCGKRPCECNHSGCPYCHGGGCPRCLMVPTNTETPTIENFENESMIPCGCGNPVCPCKQCRGQGCPLCSSA